MPKAVKYRRHDDTQSVRISRTIVNNVMTSKEAILSADAATDARFDMAESIVDFHIRSMMCAPLIDRDGDSLGVIQLDTLDPRNRFEQDDLDVLVSVACQAAFAVENAQLHEAAMREQAIKRELAVAHEVQRGFLPSARRAIPEYEFFEFYEPANQLGGDYYDYVELPGGRLAVVVADVSGKGISASLLMAKLSAETRYCLASEPSPAAAVGPAQSPLLRQRLGRPLRHHGAGGARSAAARGDRGECGPLAAAVAARARPVRGRRAKPSPACPWAWTTTWSTPPHPCPLAAGEIARALYRRDHRGDERQRRAVRLASGFLALLNSDVDRVSLLGRRILDDVKRFVGGRVAERRHVPDVFRAGQGPIANRQKNGPVVLVGFSPMRYHQPDEPSRSQTDPSVASIRPPKC